MNVMQAVRDYLDRLLARPGMKVLICDKATLGTISAAESPSGLLQREVFLTELLANLAQRDQPMPHLKAVVWVRPTVENVTALCEELREPKYGEYHINFSNVLQEQEQELQALAEADEYDLVRSVTVHYADYVALSPELFTLNIVENGTAGNSLLDAHASLSGSPRSSEAGAARLTAGLAAVLLSLKKRPFIRYSKKSPAAAEIAGAVKDFMEETSQLFEFGGSADDTAPLLLVIDRYDDPVTPLLNQWTYQAMIHELIGIRNNKVELPSGGSSGGSTASTAARVVPLNVETDAFYKDNVYADYKMIERQLEEVRAEYLAHKRSNEKLQSQVMVGKDGNAASSAATVAQFKDFLARHPKFKQLEVDVAKHQPVFDEINRRLDARQLWEVGPLEQSLANPASHDYAAHLRELQAVFDSQAQDSLGLYGVDDHQDQQSPDVVAPLSNAERARLLLLFVLQYEKELTENAGERIFDLKRTLCHANEVALIETLWAEAGLEQRTPGLFEAIQKAGERRKRLFQRLEKQVRDSPSKQNGSGAAAAAVAAEQMVGARDNDSDYLQHRPRLEQTIMEALAGTLQEGRYPHLDPDRAMQKQAAAAARRGRHDRTSAGNNTGMGTVMDSGKELLQPADIVVFVVGGVTYAEARLVHQLNAELALDPAHGSARHPMGPWEGSSGRRAALGLPKGLAPGCRIVLGGDYVTRGADFLRMLDRKVATATKGYGDHDYEY